MANVTDAIGTFTFNSDFYKENQDLIDAYFHNAKLGMSYGIFSLVNNHDGSFNFEANGRWSMQNTLKWCLTPLDSESQPIFDELFNKLRNRNQIIMFNYNDYDRQWAGANIKWLLFRPHCNLSQKKTTSLTSTVKQPKTCQPMNLA